MGQETEKINWDFGVIEEEFDVTINTQVGIVGKYRFAVDMDNRSAILKDMTVLAAHSCYLGISKAKILKEAKRNRALFEMYEAQGKADAAESIVTAKIKLESKGDKFVESHHKYLYDQMKASKDAENVKYKLKAIALEEKSDIADAVINHSDALIQVLKKVLGDDDRTIL